MGKLLLLFTIVPLVELYLLLFIGDLVGFWPTVAIVASTGALGAWLAKREGLRVLGKWQAALAESRIPEEGVLGGVLVLVGGVLLVTPGVLTDFSGFLLLIPPTRRIIAGFVMRWVERRVAGGSVQVVSYGLGGPRPHSRGPGFAAEAAHRGPRVPSMGSVIDVEGEVIDVEG